MGLRKRGQGLIVANILVEALKMSLTQEQTKMLYFLLAETRRQGLEKLIRIFQELGLVRLKFRVSDYLNFRLALESPLNKESLRVEIYKNLALFETKANEIRFILNLKRYIDWIDNQTFSSQEKEVLEPIVNSLRRSAVEIETYSLSPLTGVGKSSLKGIWIFDVHPYALPLLLNYAKDYTRLKAQVFFNLKSVYAIRLYEVFEKRKKLKRLNMSYKELLIRLGLAKYQNGNWVYSKIYEKDKSRVFKKALNPALDEINQKSDLDISYSILKSGKKITGVEFTIQTKPILERVLEIVLSYWSSVFASKEEFVGYLVNSFRNLSPALVLLYLYSLVKEEKDIADLRELLKVLEERVERKPNANGIFVNQVLKPRRGEIEESVWNYLFSEVAEAELRKLCGYKKKENSYVSGELANLLEEIL